MTDQRSFLSKLHQNLNILQEREAKYGGNAPLELLNQIHDHKLAVALTQRVISGELSQAEWRKALEPLLLAVQNGQLVTVEAETYVAGDVKGDLIGEDKVLGNKQVFQGSTYIYQPPPAFPPTEAKARRELGILLGKVKQFWIEGVLEKSVHHMALIDLGKETQAEAVAHAWEQVLELPDQSRQPLPPDKKVSQIFDEVNRALLILGAPGSGKTTTLLQLARDLIEQVEQDGTFSQPLPVVFNLSTWRKGQPLIDWLASELSAKYQIPIRIGRPWLVNSRLLPLLDGLDEVKDEDEAACIEVINTFVQEFGLAGLVVCSRTEEYLRHQVRLRLNGAIHLQPLTLEQVYNYLDLAGATLTAVRVALQQDESLRDLAKSPLMLGVMILAYRDTTVETLTKTTLNTDEARRHLFDTYIDRMFKRRGGAISSYPDQQAKIWLAWLARQLYQHNQSVFLIENLQPSWLLDRASLWLYSLGSRAIFGLIGGLTIALANWLSDFKVYGFTGTPLITGFGSTMIYWTFFGLVAGLLLGWVDGLRFERMKYTSAETGGSGHRQLITGILVRSLIVGVVLGVAHALNYGLIFGFIGGPPFGMIVGAFFGIRSRRQKGMNDIQTVEALSWSWRKARRFIPLGLIGGLTFGVLTIVGTLIIGMDEEFIDRVIGHPIFGLSAVWSAGLLSALTYGVVGGLTAATFGGLYSSILETKTVPNQGIRLSFRNGLLTGLGFGLIFALTIGTLLALFIRPSSGLTLGMGILLYIGLVAGMWYGGLDIVQHFTLSAILWYKGHIPRHYIRFLDYATERILLQKVGGGYIFIHRLLLEHFANIKVK